MANINPFKHQTKTQALTQYLIELANELGPEARLPTMAQLTEQLQVSVVTLNRALSELEAQDIIQRKHGVGIFVSPRINRKTVGLVYDRDIFEPGASPFCGLLVEESRRRAEARDEQFSFYLAVPSRQGLPVHDDLLDDLKAHRLSGLLFVGEGNPEAAAWLEKSDVPMVALSHTPVARYRVHIDWKATIALGVESLVAAGCQQIALWMPVGSGLGMEGESFPELDAFRQGLSSHGLEFSDSLVWQLNALTKPQMEPRIPNQEQGFMAAFQTFGPARSEEDLVTAGQTPDGLLILDDMMARGALLACAQLGIQVPSQLQVATHYNKGTQVLQGYEKGLTLLQLDPADIVNTLYEMLETLMAGKKPHRAVRAVAPQVVQVQDGVH